MKIPLLLLLILLPLSAQALVMPDGGPKEKGMYLYNLKGWTASLPYLEEAAEKGDVEAMYYAGEAARLGHMGTTKEALMWYLSAARADHGDARARGYAMLRLYQAQACKLADECPEGAENWKEKARQEFLPKAKEKDLDAIAIMMGVASMDDDSAARTDWIIEGAKNGDPNYQNMYGEKIENGYGFYFTQSGREEEAYKWIKKAAENGNVEAMMNMYGYRFSKGDDVAGQRWLEKASDKGFLEARTSLGFCYLGTIKEINDFCKVKPSKVKAAAILEGIKKAANVDSSFIKEAKKDMTKDQLEEVEKLSKEWAAKKPPLSKFPPMFGF